MSFASMHNDYLTPPDDDQVVDLAPAIAAAGLPDVVGYWDENGYLFAGHQYDEDGRLPQVGELVWDDDKTEDENSSAAAAIIVGMFTINLERHRTLEKQLDDYIEHKRKHPAKVPSFAAWCKSMDFPKGDFKWEDSEGGDWHASRGDESWGKVCYYQTIGREDGKVYVRIDDCDSDGNSDHNDSYTQGDSANDWRFFYREWLADTDDYFIGWARYHLDCAETHSDPLNECMRAEDACSSRFHLDAAADHLKYLTLTQPEE